MEVLRHLQPGYENSIDVIYIDPPYNTGSDGFVYPDSFSHSDEKLKAMFGLDEEGLSRLKSIQGRATHSAWLTFMYPRLWLAKRLLKDTGVILSLSTIMSKLILSYSWMKYLEKGSLWERLFTRELKEEDKLSML